MPPLPPVSQTVKTILRVAAPGITDSLLRMFFQWAGSLSNTNLNTWCSNVATAWQTNIGPLVPSAVVLNEVTAEDLTSTTGPVGVWSGSKAGSRSGGAFTPAAAFIITDLIPRRYRGGHPRSYLLGLDTSQTTPTDGNTWLSTFAATVVTDWTAFMNAISGSSGPSGTTTWARCNVSYYLGSTDVITGTPPYQRGKTKATLRTVVPTPDVIISYSYNPQIGSQRRRNHQSA